MATRNPVAPSRAQQPARMATRALAASRAVVPPVRVARVHALKVDARAARVRKVPVPPARVPKADVPPARVRLGHAPAVRVPKVAVQPVRDRQAQAAHRVARPVVAGRRANPADLAVRAEP